MNRGKISNQFLLYFLMMMFLMVTVGCSSSDNTPPPPAGTTYTVTFDSQGATTLASPTSKSVVAPATTVGALPTEPAKTSYTFAGWWTGPNGTGTEFIASTPVTADITVYACWSTNLVYTVTYNSDGGTDVGIQHAMSSGGTVGTLPAAPTKTGYNFGGWFTVVDGGGTPFTASTPVTVNIAVYAKWNSYYYTVNFDSQGATVAASPSSIIVASPATTVVTLPTQPTKTSYTFAGWWTQTGGSGTAFTASTTVTANITVYAYWSTNPVYTVTYSSEGGTAVGAQQVTAPATTVGTLPAVPTKSGYTFAGWWTGTNGAGTPFTASTPVTGNITVYAKWTAVTGTATASGTYTWSSGTGVLTINWTSSNFLCNGPSLGADTETGVTITATTMTWPNGGMTWTRSSGTLNDPAGTWTATDSETGNTYTLVVTAANLTSGTMSASAPIIACGSGDLNPGVQSHYEPGNTTWIYSVYGDYKDPNHTASAVSVTGNGITNTMTLYYNSTDTRWDYSITLGDTQPTVPLNYTFTITDTSTWTKTVTVNCFMPLYATNLSPTGTITAIPTFTWTGISKSDAVYEVYVEDSSHNQIWDKWGITGNSVLYGGPSLTSGATYYYTVTTQSRSTCLDGNSQVGGSFKYQP